MATSHHTKLLWKKLTRYTLDDPWDQTRSSAGRTFVRRLLRFLSSDRKSALVTQARNGNISTIAGPAKFRLQLHPITVQVEMSATSGSTKQLAISSLHQFEEVCMSPI